MQTIAVFGGTFDPVHKGHIDTCVKIQNQFQFDRFYFVPCKTPLLKQGCATTTANRIHMLELALAPYPQFTLDQREIKRPTPSYMVETLKSLREEHPECTSLTLIIGYDAFVDFLKWHRWQDILGLANLMVIHREGHQDLVINEELTALLITHRLLDTKKLTTTNAGSIVFFDAGSYLISSTEVRRAIKSGADAEQLLTKEVLEYINQQGLYR